MPSTPERDALEPGMARGWSGGVDQQWPRSDDANVDHGRKLDWRMQIRLVIGGKDFLRRLLILQWLGSVPLSAFGPGGRSFTQVVGVP